MTRRAASVVRVVVSNVYADDNRGGAAITSATLKLVSRSFPAARVALVSTKAEGPREALRFTVQDHPDVEVFPAALATRRGGLATLGALLRSLLILASPRAAARSNPTVARIVEADLVIGKGGQVFRGYTLKGLPGLWLTALPLLIARRCGIPAVAMGVSVGPFRGLRASERLCGWILRRLSLVMTRGEESAALARSLGVPAQRVVMVPDSVFALAGPSAEAVCAIRERLDLLGVDYLCVTVTLHSHTGAAARVPDLVGTLLRLLLDAGVAARALVVVQVDGQTSDSAYSRAIVDHVKDPRVHLMAEALSVAELLALYGGARATVGMRIHSAILSVIAGTPAFPIAVEHNKPRDIFSTFGQAEHVIDFEVSPPGQTAAMILDRLSDPGVRDATRAAAEQMRRRTEASVEHLRAVSGLDL